MSFLTLSHIKDHVRVATKLDTLKSKPQDSELPFVSASELRRFPKEKHLNLDNVLTAMIIDQ